jgi:hypothetical protein
MRQPHARDASVLGMKYCGTTHSSKNFGRRLRHGPGKQPHTWLANAGAAAAFRWVGRPAPSLMQSRRVALCTFVGQPSKKNQRVQPDRHPSLFRRRECRGALWRFAGTKKKTMKCLIILCLSLGLAGCYSTGPYASANGPVVDLSACADSADLRVDPLCHPLTRTQLK